MSGTTSSTSSNALQVQGNCVEVAPTQVSSGNCVGAACSPSQSLPQPLNGIIVSPDNVEWTPTADASCMLNLGITSLSDWLTWVEQNVITSYCSVKSASCQIAVSETSAGGTVEVVGKPVGQAIADCLGMSEQLPHVIYDLAGDNAIAGMIETPPPDCASFRELLQSCIPLAPEGEVPDILIGYRFDATVDGGFRVLRYQTFLDQPSRFFGYVEQGLDANRFVGIVADQRIIPQNMTVLTNDQGGDSNTPGTTMSYVIGGPDGFYDVSMSIFVNTTYLARAGKIVTWMAGLLVTRATGASEEYRLDEKPLYLDNTQAQTDGQDLTLTGSIGLTLLAGDTISVRVWYNDTTLSGLGHTLNPWINRSARTHLSVIRRTKQSIVVQG